MSNPVTMTPAAPAAVAQKHFESQFAFETDCWDTHEALREPDPGFVLLDVRSHTLYERGHIAQAHSLPHGKIIASKMARYPRDTLFVTYCAGPHCNGAARGAAKLATLGYAVKIMAGGISGWIDEGFSLVSGRADLDPLELAM